MQVRGKVAVVTGAAGGIGSALARRFAAEGASGVVLSDVDHEAAERIADEIRADGGEAVAIAADVTDEAQVAELVAGSERAFGPIELFCSNAGIASGVGLDAKPEDWARSWSINVVAHAHAARAVVPGMLARGSGYLLQTVSAAGLLSCAGDAPYSATKHAALGLAEWLSMTYGAAGIKVSVLCPMGVRTNMLMPGIEAGNASALAVASAAPILEPAQVADTVIAGLDAETFLILPHPEVGKMYAHKAADPDRWLAGMRRVYGENAPAAW
ncbi:MAG TPA: SDR family oxidoreductase [Pseudonocardiaceae bacterium]|jgi:NAD(P)-dependent dehydrogenase (short-subunit alcohol dehydrogenase family)|nr:SDR family oxidoreductase [Pseudonocardiaceae bacterium]